jgi:hypothetical protein
LFSQYVGVSPARFRSIARDLNGRSVEAMLSTSVAEGRCPQGANLHATITCPDYFRGWVFVGFFPTAIPQKRPEAGAVVCANPEAVVDLLCNRWPAYLLVASVEEPLSVESLLNPNQRKLLVASRRIDKPTANAGINVGISLRPCEHNDPPLLIALSVLLRDPV